MIDISRVGIGVVWPGGFYTKGPVGDGVAMFLPVRRG